MGGYGFLRFAIPLFPDAAARFAPWIGLLAVIGIVYGALVSLVQPDLKKLVAYSSVSHLGFVMLGIASFTTTAVTGAVYQMLNHGISTGALFLMVGMLYDRRHTRQIAAFGGLKTVMPWFAAVFLMISLSSIAVPGFNGFVGEFLILMGSWGARSPVDGARRSCAPRPAGSSWPPRTCCGWCSGCSTARSPTRTTPTCPTSTRGKAPCWRPWWCWRC